MRVSVSTASTSIAMSADVCLRHNSHVTDFAQSVKQQVDIVKMIEGYIRLRKAGATELFRPVPVSQGKIAVVQRARGRGSSFTASAAACRETCSRLWARSRTSAFPRRCGSWRRRAGIPLPKREFSSPEEAAEARMRGKLLDLHEAAAAGSRSSCEGRRERWRASTWPGGG